LLVCTVRFVEFPFCVSPIPTLSLPLKGRGRKKAMDAKMGKNTKMGWDTKMGMDIIGKRT
jgi:hypothetical protein